MMLLKRKQPHVGLLETSPTHLKMTKAIARYEMSGGILDLISNSVESEDGRKFFGTLSPFSVSQCLSVPVSYLFCWVARLARVQVKPGGKQIWKGIKIRPWFLKKTHQISILFAVIVGHWDNDHLCRGEEPRYPVEVLDRFLMIEQVSPRTRLPPNLQMPWPGQDPAIGRLWISFSGSEKRAQN